MPKTQRRPLVAIPCDVKMLGPHPFHAVGEKYIAAVEGGAGAKAVLVPVTDDRPSIDEIFALADGIFLTGSWSNVHPDHYGGPAPREGVLLDPARDDATLPLIRAAVDRAVPLFCVCRGFQELNVAYGGSLHQHLEEMPAEAGYAPRFDHREDKDDPLEKQYGPAHGVELLEGGVMHHIVGSRMIEVNSLHGQGVDRVGNGLTVEGRAPDGTVEALSVDGAANFALGVQWHPEWKYADNKVSLALFRAFGDAVRAAAGLQVSHEQGHAQAGQQDQEPKDRHEERNEAVR